MVTPLSEKKWLFFTKLGKRFSEKVGFSLLFEPILGGGFLDQIIASFKQKSIFFFVPGFLAVVFSQFCPNIIWKVASPLP